MRLKDKLAIVTGGGRDIGRAVSLEASASARTWPATKVDGPA